MHFAHTAAGTVPGISSAVDNEPRSCRVTGCGHLLIFRLLPHVFPTSLWPFKLAQPGVPGSAHPGTGTRLMSSSGVEWHLAYCLEISPPLVSVRSLGRGSVPVADPFSIWGLVFTDCQNSPGFCLAVFGILSAAYVFSQSRFL